MEMEKPDDSTSISNMRFTEYFNSITEIYWSEEKIPFKTWLFLDNAPDHPVALREKYHEIQAVSTLANIISILAAHEPGSNFDSSLII